MKSDDPFHTYSVTAFFHFTDRRNLPLIRNLGGLYPSAELERQEIHVPAPGGNQWSRDADARKNMDDYIHLCFRPNHPMEYLAREEGRIKDSIFLQIHPDILQLHGIMYSPDVANKSGVPIHSIADALKHDLIDFEILYTRTNWSDPALQARLQAAERSE